jgi:hypothetical protein
MEIMSGEEGLVAYMDETEKTTHKGTIYKRGRTLDEFPFEEGGI